MAKIYDMMQERAEVTKSIRSLMDLFNDKEMPAEEKEKLQKMEDRYDDLNGRIMIEEKQLERERAAGEIVAPQDEPQSETKELFAKALSGRPEAISQYQNALSLGVDLEAGNLTAPMEFVQKLIKGLDNILFMRQLSTVVGPIGAAQSLGFPYRSAEATDATWTAEVDPAVEETSLQYGRREFKPNKLAKLIKLSKALVQHAPLAENAVMQEILFRISTAQESGYMIGNGTAQPLGIFTASDSGIPASRDVATDNAATAVTFDGLQNAKYSLKQQYWANASWVMHRDLAGMLAKIKNGEGQYVWQDSVIVGQPNNLLGFPVYMSEYAPNTYTANLYAAVLGDFKNGYWICDSDQVQLQVLRELFAVNGLIGYLVDYFGDGAPVVAEAFARVKMGA